MNHAFARAVVVIALVSAPGSADVFSSFDQASGDTMMSAHGSIWRIQVPGFAEDSENAGGVLYFRARAATLDEAVSSDRVSAAGAPALRVGPEDARAEIETGAMVSTTTARLGDASGVDAGVVFGPGADWALLAPEPTLFASLEYIRAVSTERVDAGEDPQ